MMVINEADGIAPIQYLPWFNVLVNNGEGEKKERKKLNNCIYRVISHFFFSASLALFIYGDVGANKVLDDGGGCLPFGTSVGPPSFLLLLKQHVFHREWRTLSSTLPHHVPYLPRIFKTSIFRHCTYLSRFPTGFVFPFHFYAISRMLIGRAHCKKKKKELGENRMNIWFPAESRIRIRILSCAQFIVAEYSERQWIAIRTKCSPFYFPPKCQTKWMKCGSRWETFRLFVYGLCFFFSFSFRFVECGRAYWKPL